MAVLSWGKPTVEIGKIGAADAAPTTWTTLPEIVEGTTNLNSEQGNKIEAVAEGGEIIDVRYSKNKYTLELELFVVKGAAKPIEDVDGVILDNYAVRLTPEDEATEGFIIDKASVSCTETWTSANGKRWKYIFSGLKPKTGNIIKPYLKPAVEE